MVWGSMWSSAARAAAFFRASWFIGVSHQAVEGLDRHALAGGDARALVREHDEAVGVGHGFEHACALAAHRDHVRRAVAPLEVRADVLASPGAFADVGLAHGVEGR